MKVLLQVHAYALQLVVPGLLQVLLLLLLVGIAVKLLLLLCLLAFDLYRVNEFESTVSCPTKTIKKHIAER